MSHKSFNVTKCNIVNNKMQKSATKQSLTGECDVTLPKEDTFQLKITAVRSNRLKWVRETLIHKNSK